MVNSPRRSLPTSKRAGAKVHVDQFRFSHSLGQLSGANQKVTMFGSPSYPSPLDRIRTGRRDRAQQFGLTPLADISFDANQSFPKANRLQFRNDKTPDVKPRKSLFKGDCLNDVSFSAGHSKGSFSHSPDHHQGSTSSLGEGWSFFKYIGGGQSGITFPTTVKNPNKAICTLNAKTSQILTANEMACELFAFDQSELVGMKLTELMQVKSRDQHTIMETYLEPSGELVEMSGKVVDVIDSSGLVLPVSLWLKKLPDKPGYPESRCIAVLEPVDRSQATVEFDEEGTILSCDDELAHIHGYMQATDITGMKIAQLIPSFKQPIPGQALTKDIRKQTATGKTRDGSTFPLSIRLNPVKRSVMGEPDKPSKLSGHRDHTGDLDLPVKEVYVGVIWVFANISGMISFLPDGTIHTINENFALMLFGYRQHELIGKHISKLIPDFNELIDEIEDEDNCILAPSSDGECERRETTPGDTKYHDESLSDSEASSSAQSRSASANHSHQSVSEDQGIGISMTSNCVQRSKLSLLAGPEITSTPTRSPGSNIVRHDTDDLIIQASKIVRQTEKRLNKDMLQVDGKLSPRLYPRELDSSYHSQESSLSSDASTKTGHGCQRNGIQGNAGQVTLLSPISMQGGQKKHEGKQTSLEKSSISLREVLNKFGEQQTMLDINVKDQLEKEYSKENLDPTKMRSCSDLETNTTELIAAHIPNVDLYLSSSDTDTEQTSRRSGGMARSIVLLSKSKVANEITRTTDLKVKTKISKPELSTELHKKMVMSDSETSNELSSNRVKDDKKSSPANGSKAYKRLRRSHVGRGQNTSVLKSDSPKGDENARHSPNMVKMKDAQTTSRLSDGVNVTDPKDSGRFSISVDQGKDKNQPMAMQDETSRSNSSQSRIPLPKGREKFFSDLLDPFRRDTPKHTTSLLMERQWGKNNVKQDNKSSNAFHLSLDDLDKRFDSFHLTPFNIQSDIGLIDKHEKSIIEDTSPVFMSPRRNGSDRSCNQLDTSTHHYKESNFKRNFRGHGRHRDGSRLGVMFQIKPVELEDGNVVYCMWVSRDPQEPGEGGRSFSNLTLASSLNMTVDSSNASFSLGEALIEKAQSTSKADIDLDHSKRSVIDNDDDDINEEEGDPDNLPEGGAVCLNEGRGPYNQQYDTLHSIGKGAFGFVRLARRKTDGEEVVVKFIQRSKVLSESWVQHDDLGRCPLEIDLLSKLDHPNIVKVLEVCMNDNFYQMVMEKHGTGMDLFEFIDRRPRLDEALASYLFRQIVSAMHYLHCREILHRDIKDENIILDESFHIKLIDFGAAAYLQPGKIFATFCGTLEYCSPEVLLGNRYRGPELEIWSMGVTLYTLLFGENPFYDVEEIIQCVLNPPSVVSNALTFLLSCMLKQDPCSRATIEEVAENKWVNQRVDITQYSWKEVLPNSEFHGNTGADNREDSAEASADSDDVFGRGRFVYHYEKIDDDGYNYDEQAELPSDSDETEELHTELQRCLSL